MLAKLLIDRFTDSDRPAVSFSKRRCIRSRFNKNDCRICLDGCETEALILEGRMIAFDTNKCSSCMRCAANCPNDAFTTEIDIISLLEKLRHADKVYTLHCKKSLPARQGITVPCFGWFSEPLLAVINSVMKTDIILDISHCKDCSNKHVLSPFHAIVKRLSSRIWQKNITNCKFIIEDKSVDLKDSRKSRRSYLQLAKKPFVHLGKNKSSDKRLKEGASSKHGSKSAVMMSVVLGYGYRHSSPDAKRTLHSYFHTARTTDLCDLCPACQGMCPTGALKRKVITGKKQLLFTSSICSGCGLCEQFCRKQAISITSGYKKDPLQSLPIR